LNGGCPIVVPVLIEKSAHVKKMVQKQKYNPPKRGSGFKLPAHCRSSVYAIPQMSSDHYSTNYNSNDKQQHIFLPVSLQQRIKKMIHDNPKVMLQNFSEMCSVTNSTFCICIVLLKPKERK